MKSLIAVVKCPIYLKVIILFIFFLEWWVYFYTDSGAKRTQDGRIELTVNRHCKYVVEFFYYIYGTPGTTEYKVISETDNKYEYLEMNMDMLGSKSKIVLKS